MSKLQNQAKRKPQTAKSSQGGQASQKLMQTPAMQLKAQENKNLFNSAAIQQKENNTGLPDSLKNGMEALSGVDLSSVRVHTNSSAPAEVGAHAFAQGNDIHLGSGQEKHLPHELGHVVQQAQGKVKATTNIGGVAVNDNPSLEKEATALGKKALQKKT